MHCRSLQRTLLPAQSCRALLLRPSLPASQTLASTFPAELRPQMEGTPGHAVHPFSADLIMSRYRPIAPRPAPFPSPASLLQADAGDGGRLQPSSLLPPNVERAMTAAASRWARKRRRGRVMRPRRVQRTKKAMPIRAMPAKLRPQKQRSQPSQGSVTTEAKKWAHSSSGFTEATRLLPQDAGFLARAAANAHPPHHLESHRSRTFAEIMGSIMGFPAAPAVSMHNLMPQAAMAPFMGMPLVSLDLLESENTAPSWNPTASDDESRLGFPSTSSPSSTSHYCEQLGAQHTPAPAGELADEFHLSNITMYARSDSSSVEKGLCLKLDQSDGEDSRNCLMSLEEGSDSSHVTKTVGCTEDVEGADGNECIIEPVTLSLFPTSCRIASSHTSGSTGFKNFGMERENAHWISLKPLVLNDDLHDATAPNSGTVKDWSPVIDGCVNVTTTSSLRKALHGCRSLDKNASRSKPVTIAPHFHRLTRSIVRLVSITEVHMRSALSRHEHFQVLKQQHEGIAAPVIMSSYNTGIRIRWVNTAYKQMIGQPQCPWLMSLIAASLMRDGCKEELQSPLLAGEVSIHCCVKFPNTACAFSGWVKVEWSKYGSERGFSIALPCDVTRWVCEDDGGSVLFVWKLDVEACLKLTCGG